MNAMQVMVYARPGEMRIEQRPCPTLVDNEVVIKVCASGICGSDLHGFRGHDRTRSPGMILGHEFAGIIVESAHPRFSKGTLATSNSAFTCGHCAYCVRGSDNLCASRRSLGKHRQGAYAEFVAVPVSALIDVAQDMNPVLAALTEPLANGVHAIGHAMKIMDRPMAEASALVIGGGAVGFLSAILLRYYGCHDIVLAETNPLRRAFVKQHIDCRICNPLEEEIDIGAFDFVLDAVGSGASNMMAVRGARPGGVIAQVGLQDHDVKLDVQRLTRSQITLAGIGNYPTIALFASVRILESGTLGDLSWVELRPLAEGPRAFEDLASGKVASPKIILLPH